MRITFGATRINEAAYSTRPTKKHHRRKLPVVRVILRMFTLQPAYLKMSNLPAFLANM